jgi:protein TonB
MRILRGLFPLPEIALNRNALFAALVAASISLPAAPALTDTTPIRIAPLQRIDPEFPRTALRAGAERGMVTARMTLDSDGKVTRVDIVQSEPRRVFDDAVTQALSQWRYPEGRSGRVVEVEVAFKQK